MLTPTDLQMTNLMLKGFTSDDLFYLAQKHLGIRCAFCNRAVMSVGAWFPDNIVPMMRLAPPGFSVFALMLQCEEHRDSLPDTADRDGFVSVAGTKMIVICAPKLLVDKFKDNATKSKGGL